MSSYDALNDYDNFGDLETQFETDTLQANSLKGFFEQTQNHIHWPTGP